MKSDYAKHKTILLQILKDIYTDASLAPYLGFKGGTAALLFYNLNRNSVDLDFDLLDETKQEVVFEKLQKITADYGKITESRIKRFSLLNIISYAPGAPQIKVEVSRRNFGSRYEPKTLLGIAMLVMVREDMFANKLMAMLERIGKTSRDVFDVYFFFTQKWEINRDIVEQRTGVPFSEALKKCIELLEDLKDRYVLDGLGELLTDGQKDWARVKLKTETIFFLKLALEAALESFTIESSQNLTFTDIPGQSFSGTDQLTTSYLDVKNAQILDLRSQNKKTIVVKILSDTTGHEASCYIRSKNDEGVREIQSIVESDMDWKSITYDAFLHYSFRK